MKKLLLLSVLCMITMVSCEEEGVLPAETRRQRPSDPGLAYLSDQNITYQRFSDPNIAYVEKEDSKSASEKDAE